MQCFSPSIIACVTSSLTLSANSTVTLLMVVGIWGIGHISEI
jgi:hypothetical protein